MNDQARRELQDKIVQSIAKTEEEIRHLEEASQLMYMPESKFCVRCADRR